MLPSKHLDILRLVRLENFFEKAAKQPCIEWSNSRIDLENIIKKGAGETVLKDF